MSDLQELYDAIVRGDAPLARSLTEHALTRQADALEIVTKTLTPAMDEVGKRFESSEYFVPELLLAARAMRSAMELLRPILAARGEKSSGRVVIGTVRGDLHDIGKNLVAAMLEGGGFEVFDLGVNVAPEKFIAATREKDADIVAMSALLTTTMSSMKTTIAAFEAAGLRDRVQVLVGGAPLSKEYAEEIGADGYGLSAVDAVALAKSALERQAAG